MLAISTHVFHNIQEAIVHVRMVRKLDLHLVQIRQRIAHIECRLDFPGQYDVSPFLFFLYACIHTMAVAAASVYLIQASHAGSGASRERLTAQVQINRRSRVRSSGVRV